MQSKAILFNSMLLAALSCSAISAAHAGYAAIGFEASAENYIYEGPTHTYITNSVQTPGNWGDVANGYYDTGDVVGERGNHAGVSGSIYTNVVPTISLQGYAVSAANGPHHWDYEERLTASFSGSGTIEYLVNVTGPGGYVPFFVSGTTYGHKTSGVGFGGEIKSYLDLQDVKANGVFDSQADAATSTYTHYRASTGDYNYHANFGNEFGKNNDDSFSTSFVYEIYVQANTTFKSLMTASVQGFAGEGEGQASVYMDPYFYIDPVWLQAHPGYSLQTEAGFGNSAAVPVPGAIWLFGSGLLGLISLKRRQNIS
ncbi:PEP-CTERM sorting domain-containing protein [Methylomonas sp. UP202]|uniref:PEP-CTERM sorting domain-containing protein n=1 Tax=unclassified Methylomonas TaxID=2608980 RepID=UPI00247A5F1B|nr:PEP-CTERM sorting domain-containing protein [Methylomonas sp. UP202]WGS85422.1 PEP-CTERM sorting domain-containing protein [Methylomonas sp. UP202]